eukprot:TRINITY_DN67768_c8_g1_i1.p1 TRINITY_DN67768_c8_g1~~TRINITY_DN67768_c8_g1_i1.p1  ORF type:complete len:167 (+),score=22.85 TRINITY_DN67768_c8_g1_i1:48-548(+)
MPRVHWETTVVGGCGIGPMEEVLKTLEGAKFVVVFTDNDGMDVVGTVKGIFGTVHRTGASSSIGSDGNLAIDRIHTLDGDGRGFSMTLPGIGTVGGAIRGARLDPVQDGGVVEKGTVEDCRQVDLATVALLKGTVTLELHFGTDTNLKKVRLTTYKSNPPTPEKKD